MTPHTPTALACSNCSMRDFCMPLGLSEPHLQRIDALVSTRRKLVRGEPLYCAGDRFTALYAIRTGFFKTTVGAPDGREQVTGFQMAGEVLGLDGIVNSRYGCDAIALEDAQVCVMPFDRLEDFAQEIKPLQHHLHRLMSREIVCDQRVMLLLGSMSAQERVAAFLLNLTQRLHARGLSSKELVLRMTREEIGSYLGLQLETVSRTFSKLASDGVIEAQQRHVRILNMSALERLAAAETSSQIGH